MGGRGWGETVSCGGAVGRGWKRTSVPGGRGVGKRLADVAPAAATARRPRHCSARAGAPRPALARRRSGLGSDRRGTARGLAGRPRRRTSSRGNAQTGCQDTSTRPGRRPAAALPAALPSDAPVGAARSRSWAVSWCGEAAASTVARRRTRLPTPSAPTARSDSATSRAGPPGAHRATASRYRRPSCCRGRPCRRGAG